MIKPNPHEQELIDFLISKGFKDNSPYPFTRKDISIEFGLGYINRIYSTVELIDGTSTENIIIDDFKISKVDELTSILKHTIVPIF